MSEQIIYSDAFDAFDALDADWRWLRENPDHWRLVDGGLEIRVEPGLADTVINALLRGASRQKPLSRQKEAHGVGKPRLLSGNHCPVPSNMGTPMAPTSGWASAWASTRSKVSSGTTVSGFNSSTQRPLDCRMAALLPALNPRFSSDRMTWTEG